MSGGGGERERSRQPADEGHRRLCEGYNTEAVVDEDQIVLAAEITNNPERFLEPEPDDHRSDRRAGSPGGRRPRSPTRKTATSSTWAR